MVKSSLHRATSVLVLALGLGGLGAAGGCSNAPSEQQCQQLLEHLIDLEIAASGGKNVTEEMKADLAKQKKQIADYAATKYTESCVKRTPTSVVECALKARTLDEVAKCDERK